MPSYDPKYHHRQSNRMKGYDYSIPGAYFVTLVTKNRHNLFGTISNGIMVYNQIGEIALAVWLNLPNFFPVRIDEWVLMPNHLHGIIWILDSCKGEASANSQKIFHTTTKADASPQHRPLGTRSGSLGAIIQNYKSVTTRKINQWNNNLIQSVWQRNYYDHIIRNQRELERITDYITTNPRQWLEDEEYLS